MKFDLKEMYSYLLSHTLPGLLLLVEISVFFYTTHKDILDKLLQTASDNVTASCHTAILSPVILILAVYTFSTLLGTMLDGIQHFFFDFIIDPGTQIKKCFATEECIKSFKSHPFRNFCKWYYESLSNKAAAKAKFEAILRSKDVGIKAYKHFIEDDLWYPYEAYANITVAMLLGIKFLAGILSDFWLLYWFVLIVLGIEAVATYKFCNDEEEAFWEVK